MHDLTRFHAVPDRPGYDRYTIEIASPELPCGASWLANCLIELGVPAWKPWGSDDATHWATGDDGSHRYVGGDNGWSRLLPALRDGRTLRFRAGACVRVHHVWPGVYPAAARRVLFVRDPCDALYSDWRRHLAHAGTTPDFRAYCNARYFHYPLSRRDYLRVFLRSWRHEAERADIRVVRFEDYRADALATLAGVAAWLGLDTTPGELARAADASSVERVKAEDRRLLGLGVVDRTLLRGEPPGESTRELDAPTIAWLRGAFADVDDWLGYATGALPVAERPCDDGLHEAVIGALHAAGIPLARSDRLALVLRDALAGVTRTDA